MDLVAVQLQCDPVDSMSNPETVPVAELAPDSHFDSKSDDTLVAVAEKASCDQFRPQCLMAEPFSMQMLFFSALLKYNYKIKNT